MKRKSLDQEAALFLRLAGSPHPSRALVFAKAGIQRSISHVLTPARKGGIIEPWVSVFKSSQAP
jgi:hypothetical protein